MPCARHLWRPVEARRLSPDTWLIVDQDYHPSTERWEFKPGTAVSRKEKRDGRQILVATEAARQILTG